MAETTMNIVLENGSLTPSKTITLNTAGTYVTNNIAIPLSGKIQTASPAFDGGTLSGGSTSSFTNVTTSSTNNGILVQTKYTANRAAVLYNGAVEGWVSKANDAQALASDSLSSTNGTAYYITAVTVPVDKPFSVTTTADTALDSTSDLTITNAAYRKVVVANSGTVVATSGSNSVGNVQIAAYATGTSSTAEDTQTVVENGVWKTYSKNPTSSAQGPFYGKTSITAVSQTNLSAANIKSGTTITIKGGSSNIWSVAGTFTSDGTITAADVLADKIGYSQGSQVVGTMANNGALGGTITSQNGTYTIPAGYTSGGTVTATLSTTSVTQNAWSKNSSTKIVTTNTASWGTGYITTGSVSAATFANSATNGVTYIDLSDGKKDSSTMMIPEIPAGGKLYINRGYVDNICIDLARLIPDASAVTGLAAAHILSGHSAYDNAGNLIVGSITSKAAATYYTSTTDQTISSGQYLSGDQTIKAVTTTNITAANVKYGVTAEVGDSADSDRVLTVTGTFTATPSGKTAVTAAAMRSGYSGFINGTQVDGTMPDTSVTVTASNTGMSTYFNEGSAGSNSVSITPSYTNTTAGYLAAHSTAQNGTVQYYTIKTATFTGDGGNVALVADTTSNSIYQSTTNTGNVSVESSAPTTDSGYVYIKVTGSGTAKASAAGWITANGATATGSSTKYIKILEYDGSFTVA